MSFAGQVLRELDVPGLERDLLAARHFDFAAAAQRDDVLALRRRMPILHRAGGSPMNLGTRDLHQLRHVATRYSSERRLNFLGMRLIVGAGVHPRDVYTLARLRRHHVAAGLDARHVEQRADDEDSWPLLS